MRLTIDIDDRSFTWFVKRKLPLLCVMFPGKRIEAEKSAGGWGYHVIVYNTGLSWEECLQIRAVLGDDAKRVKIDAARHARGIGSQVLFTGKKFGRRKPRLVKPLC